jgi:hypothetical protein
MGVVAEVEEDFGLEEDLPQLILAIMEQLATMEMDLLAIHLEAIHLVNPIEANFPANLVEIMDLVVVEDLGVVDLEMAVDLGNNPMEMAGADPLEMADLANSEEADQMVADLVEIQMILDLGRNEIKMLVLD